MDKVILRLSKLNWELDTSQPRYRQLHAAVDEPTVERWLGVEANKQPLKVLLHDIAQTLHAVEPDGETIEVDQQDHNDMENETNFMAFIGNI